MGTHAKVRGFTLIELLIALTIFGMVIGIATYGYSLFSRHWEGRLGHFQRAQDQYQRLDLVVAALENTLPYVVRGPTGAPGFYFLGREEGLTLVTMSPIFSAGNLAVVRVFREPSGNGGWNLLYEEAPLKGVQLRLASQTLPFQHRMVVLRDLPDLAFSYFGWRSIEKRMAVGGRAGARLHARVVHRVRRARTQRPPAAHRDTHRRFRGRRLRAGARGRFVPAFPGARMRRERGIALIQVLLVTGIIALLMLQMGLTAREQVARAQALVDRAEVQLAAQSRESALLYTLLTEQLVRVPDSENPYVAAWNFHGEPFTVDGITFSIQDESGRMRVPLLDSRGFESMLHSLGVESLRAKALGRELMTLQGRFPSSGRWARRSHAREMQPPASTRCRTWGSSGCCRAWTRHSTNACDRC